MNESPDIETEIIGDGDRPAGVGEAGTPPIAPAVANAVFALTGKRLRTLPLKLV
jgi:isoquinoline 1-oxidoreductase beta subunit